MRDMKEYPGEILNIGMCSTDKSNKKGFNLFCATILDISDTSLNSSAPRNNRSDVRQNGHSNIFH